MIVRGAVRVPGDKSVSHRAFICAALARGRSVVRRPLGSADVRSTRAVLRELGAGVEEHEDHAVVNGRGPRGLTPPHGPLDCGNSGTTARIIAGVLAGHAFPATLVGDASLGRRPMRRVAEPLRRMGARVEFPAGGDTLPMRVEGGPLVPIDYASPTASAQVKSAVLFAGLVAGVRVSVCEPAPSRDHTERMLRALGQHVRARDHCVTFEPSTPLEPFDLTVPGDPSSAAFLAALAALAGGGELRLPDVCLNPTRLGFYQVLERFGARVSADVERHAGGEPVGTVTVLPGALRGTTVAGIDVPSLIDEIPLVACVAARAEGETVVRDAAELRVKESDRIAAVVANLRAVGVTADELPDGVRVVGAPGRSLRGRVTTYGDHRIAMAFAVLGAASGGEITIDDPGCVDVSYPDFWRDLAGVCR